MPAMARMSLQLQPAQLQRLERKQTERNQDFIEDFVSGTPQERLDKRVERSAKRIKQFYGSLSSDQEALLRQWLERSPWDAQRALASRQRLQQDIVNSVRAVQSRHRTRPSGDTAPAPTGVATALRAIADSALQPADPATRANQDAFQRHSCAQLAALHNSMSAAQRQELDRTLGRYADDLASFIRPD
jgi:hypothetical protein